MVVARLAPTLREALDLIAALTARVAVLEAERQVREDGPARPPGRWLRMKAAARATGRSVSGLKKLCRQGRVVFDDDAPCRLINVDSVPRKRVFKVSKMPEMPA
jgi:hypothetical protein